MIEELFKNGIVQSFQKDEVIVNAYEKPHGVYLIKKGFVKSYSVTERGDVNIQLLRSKGNIFPLLFALGDKKRDVFFAAMDDVEVRRISVTEFKENIEKNEKLSKEMNRRLVEIYLLMAERVRNLEQRRAKERLEYCLESLAQRFGKRDGNNIIIAAPVHHHDIADLINTSRETTSREFALLERKGKVKYINGQIALIN